MNSLINVLLADTFVYRAKSCTTSELICITSYCITEQ